MLEDLQLTSFEAHVGSGFRLSGTDIELTLKEAVAVGAPNTNIGDNIREQAFSLLFDGPRDPMLEQQTYELEHAEMGKLVLFLVPVGPGEYESVFS